MKQSWLRLYAEAIDDDKLRLLAFEDRWHYVALLCCKAQGILDEAGALLMRRVAVKLGVQLRELDEIARRLAEVELIDRETLQPLGWDARQFVSDADATAAERKRRQRERGKAANDVTDASRVTVTDMSRVTVTSGHGDVTRTDTETDTEEQPLPSVVVACAHEREEPTTTTAPTARPAVRQHPRQNFQQLLKGEITDAYREILESAGALPIAQWTANRTFKAQMWWEQFGMTLEGWREYLLCIRNNCGWLLRRRRGKEGRPLPPTSVDFVMTEQCYLAVAEGRYDEVAA
jgi:hypothetical protein